MKKSAWIEFTVEGRGPFPFDMLRYDGCFPKSAIDAGSLEHHRSERRRIELCSYRGTPPTKERWKSFSWEVVDIEAGIDQN